MKRINVKRSIRPIIGVLLIGLSIGGIIYWEIEGREALLMDSVVVASVDILPGMEITDALLTSANVLKESRVKGSIDSDHMGSLIGKTANQLTLKNAQLSISYFEEKDMKVQSKESLFVIKADWIDMVSSSARRGDLVEIYGGELLGVYRVAFVKDKEDREITSIGSFVKNADNFVERTDSTAVIDHIEIICTLEEYEKIEAYATGETAPTLVVVQRKEKA